MFVRIVERYFKMYGLVTKEKKGRKQINVTTHRIYKDKSN